MLKEFFIMSYYIFKIKCREKMSLIILIYQLHRSFFRIIKKLMTVLVFAYLGFTVVASEITKAKKMKKRKGFL